MDHVFQNTWFQIPQAFSEPSMKTAIWFWLSASLSIALVSIARASDHEIIDGREYVRLDGRWFVYGTRGEKWEIASGLISIKFDAGKSQDEIDQWTAANRLEKRPGFPRIEFRIAGALNAAGTGASPIVFESWTPTTTADWVGFKFLVGSAGGSFVNCKIYRAEKAIESWAALIVRNTRIEDCGAGIEAKAGPSLVQGCKLIRPGAYGLKIKAGTTTVRNSRIDDATGAACQVDSVGQRPASC